MKSILSPQRTQSSDPEDTEVPEFLFCSVISVSELRGLCDQVRFRHEH